MIEYVRNVLGYRDADHQESSPEATQLAVTALACSLVGQSHTVRFRPGSRLAEIYGTHEADEGYFCNYGIAPDFEALLGSSGLTISATDEGAVRAVELPGHPFFVGTLYISQVRSTPVEPHPLIAAFLSAARQTARAPATT